MTMCYFVHQVELLKESRLKKKKDYYYLVLPTISLKQAKGSVTLVVTSGETEPRNCPRKEVVGNA